MKKLMPLAIMLALTVMFYAESALPSHPNPVPPYVKRHSALDSYPFKNDGLDQLSRADFALNGNVRKMYIQTSDIIGEPGSLRDHVIVRFDSLGKVQTTITYPQGTVPQGFRYVYRPDGQLLRVERYNYQDELVTGSPDRDDIFPLAGNDAEYFHNAQGQLTRIVFYDAQGEMLREYVYTYSAKGYSVALNHAVESRRNRNQIFFHDAGGKLIASQKKDDEGRFIYTAKYSFDQNKNTETILQDYLHDTPTQKTVNVLDAAGRLKESTITDPQGVPMRKYTYTYDAQGRLIKQIYSSPNDKITTVYTYQTDAQGNLTEYTSGPGNAAENFRLTIRYQYY